MMKKTLTTITLGIAIAVAPSMASNAYARDCEFSRTYLELHAHRGNISDDIRDIDYHREQVKKCDKHDRKVLLIGGGVIAALGILYLLSSNDDTSSSFTDIGETNFGLSFLPEPTYDFDSKQLHLKWSFEY